MSIEIISNKSINSSSYTNSNDVKKIDSKKDGTSDTSKTQVITQELGTDTFIKSTDQEATNSTYKPVKKKLSAEELKMLKDEQQNLKTDLIKQFISDTIKNQNKLLGKSIGSESNEKPNQTTDLLTKIFGSVEKAYPPIVTDVEGAKKAIEEGGAYSVNAVADRIMTMATYIAGDDPGKLQKMREAVEKGFSQAGLDFNKATKSDLPQICKDTMTEVMKRFDAWQNKTSSTD
jgi:hypothetical protein